VKVLQGAFYADVLFTIRVASGRPVQILPKVGTSPRSPAPPASADSGGENILKIVLVAVGVLFLFGVIAVGGIYYTALRYVKLPEEATCISAGDVANKIHEAAKRPSHGSSERNPDGCVLLSNDEASAIWGLEVERLDGKPNDPESSERREYFVKPETADENVEETKQAAAVIANGSKIDANQLAPDSIYMFKAVNRAGREGARNSKAPYFAFTVEHENGRLGHGDMATGGSSEPLGVGDLNHCGLGGFRMTSSTTVVRLSKG
jgi:hypothetical protein